MGKAGHWRKRRIRVTIQGGQRWSVVGKGYAGGGEAREPKSKDTLSAARFAELTGVTRERLRTWERRHGFPRPVRSGTGPRRYAASDASRVIAVREAAEAGVPVARAIKQARRIPVAAPARLARRPGGIDPRLAAAAGGRRVRSGAPAGGIRQRDSGRRGPGRRCRRPDLRSSRERCCSRPFRRWMEPRCTARWSRCSRPERGRWSVEHPPWIGPSAGLQRSLLFRVPRAEGPPLCAIVSIDAERERREREELTALVADHAREQQAAACCAAICCAPRHT